MKKWEYLCAYYGKSIDETILNNIGDQGWELIVSIQMHDDKDRMKWIFKREKIEIARPDSGD